MCDRFCSVVFLVFFNTGTSLNVMPTLKFLQRFLTKHKYLNREIPKGHTYSNI